jgi:adenosylcobinamide kinase / adenosylcobinamide-phosphate guanylyltransferase
MITFISGGARSGKSHFAEQYALQFNKNQQLNDNQKFIYIATAERTDCEMEERINRHIKERESIWKTTEEPIHITDILENLKNQEVILLDCLTVWLSNMMYKENAGLPQIMDEIAKLLRQQNHHLIIVSNDVNEELPNENWFVQQYIYFLEEVHRQITSKADSIFQVVAGIPIKWKG